MNFQESLRTGLDGLVSHKLRSFLTMMGIIFGVSAVISMLSIGEGAKQEALEQIKLMGMNNIIIQDFPVEGDEEGYSRTNYSFGLTISDAQALEEICPLVEMAVPQTEMTVGMTYGSNTITATLVGTKPGYARIMNLPLAKGSFLTYDDLLQNRRVCIIGDQVRQDLFQFEEPVGKKIKISDIWFTVIGLIKDINIPTTKQGSIKIRNLNQDVYIPITSALKRFHRNTFDSEINQITTRVSDTGKVRETANIIRNIMERRHNNVEDYQIIIPEALLHQSQRTQHIFNIVMGAIAGISLLVGGIGIMNIMLATILERTREIGVRRAVGATRREIMGQFIIEAVIISFTGGIIGISLGYAMTRIIAAYAGWSTIVTIYSIFLAFGVSVTVGLIFGILPARKAALLDPIESLRYE